VVAKPRAESPIGRSAPRGNQPLPRSEDMPGFGSGRAVPPSEPKAEEKTSETVIQKIFDELPVP